MDAALLGNTLFPLLNTRQTFAFTLIFSSFLTKVNFSELMMDGKREKSEFKVSNAAVTRLSPHTDPVIRQVSSVVLSVNQTLVGGASDHTPADLLLVWMLRNVTVNNISNSALLYSGLVP